MIRSLAAALGFLTTLPVPTVLLGPRLVPPAGMLWWWTPIGALLGGLAALAVAWAALFHVPWATCAVLGVVLLAALSGGLHLDGFMDTCDGLGSRAPRERALEIMKDSHAGAFGVLGVVCLLLLKVAALAGLPPERGLQALWLAPVAGRAAQMLVLAGARYARPGEGLGSAFFTAATSWHALAALLLALGLSCGRAPGLLWPLLAALALGTLVALGIGRRLGGHTGDTVGAVSEMAECLFLLCCLPSL